MIFQVINEAKKTCQVGTGSNIGCLAVPTTTKGEITIPETVNGYTVTDIGDFAFADGKTSLHIQLSKIGIPKSVTTIGRYAFWKVIELRKITLPPNLLTIKEHAFSGCTNLGAVRSYIEEPFEIPSSVFSEINSYASLTIPFGTKEKYLAANGWDVFSKIYDEMAIVDGIRYSVEQEDEKGNTAWVRSAEWTAYEGNVVIPMEITVGDVVFTVKGIDDGAFKNSMITSVSIPNTVTHIDELAFANCTQLQAVYSYITDPQACYVRADAFRNLPSDATLYVPAGCKAAYEAAAYWNEFNEIVELTETNSVRGIEKGQSVMSSDDFYSLYGQKLGGKPTQRGVYINKGKKVVIK